MQKDSGFLYTTADSTEVMHSAHLWLREGSIAQVQTRYRNVALDQRTIDVIRIAGGAEEAEGVIRFDNDPDGLLAMLVAGADGITLDYYMDLSGSTFYTFALMNYTTPRIVPDAQRHGFGEWQADVVLRLIDGGSLAELYE
jgi:hypothetical protein